MDRLQMEIREILRSEVRDYKQARRLAPLGALVGIVMVVCVWECARPLVLQAPALQFSAQAHPQDVGKQLRRSARISREAVRSPLRGIL